MAKKKKTGRRKDHDTVRGTEDEMVAHESGAKRSVTEGKGRFDLLSFWGNRRIAQHMENGLKKYAARNWEKGMPLSRYADAALRHMQMFLAGFDDEDHLAAAGWNIHALIHTQEMIRAGVLPAELDDLVGTEHSDLMTKFLYGDDASA